MSSEIDGTTTIVCGSWFIASIECHSGTSRSWSSSNRSCACAGDAGNPVSVSMAPFVHKLLRRAARPRKCEQVRTGSAVASPGAGHAPRARPRRSRTGLDSSSTASSCSPRPGCGSACSVRTAPASPPCSDCSRVGCSPERGTVVRTPPTATVGELRQEPERRPGETVGGYLARRTGVADADAALDAATAALADGRAGADDAYSSALDRWLALGAADFDVRVGETFATVGLSAPICSTPRPPPCPAGRRRGSGSPRCCCRASTSSCSTSRPTTSTSPDSTSSNGSCSSSPARWSWSATTARSSTASSRTSPSSTRTTTRSRCSPAAGPRTCTSASSRGVTPRSAYAEYEGQRATLRSRAQREREWAHQGVAKEKKSPRDSDKVGRDFRKNQTERLAARSRRTEQAMARLDAVEKPWEDWELRFTVATAPRAGAVVARLDGAVGAPRRVPARAGDNRDRLGRERRHRRAQRRRQDHAPRGAARATAARSRRAVARARRRGRRGRPGAGRSSPGRSVSSTPSSPRPARR